MCSWCIYLVPTRQDFENQKRQKENERHRIIMELIRQIILSFGHFYPPFFYIIISLKFHPLDFSLFKKGVKHNFMDVEQTTLQVQSRFDKRSK